MKKFGSSLAAAAIAIGISQEAPAQSVVSDVNTNTMLDQIGNSPSAGTSVSNHPIPTQNAVNAVNNVNTNSASYTDARSVKSQPGPAKGMISIQTKNDFGAYLDYVGKIYPNTAACVADVLKVAAESGRDATINATCENKKTGDLVAKIDCKKEFGELACKHRVNEQEIAEQPRAVTGTFTQYPRNDVNLASPLRTETLKFNNLADCDRKTASIVAETDDLRVKGVCSDAKTERQLSRQVCGRGGVIMCYQ